MKNSATEKQTTLQNTEEERIVQDLSLELVGKTSLEEMGENSKCQGNKIQYGSRGKQQRERRKLREKRRSTGVVHLDNTESAGGSTTGEEEGKEEMGGETKKNTEQNEMMGKNIEQLLQKYKLIFQLTQLLPRQMQQRI